jgi:hypothetical protein
MSEPNLTSVSTAGPAAVYALSLWRPWTEAVLGMDKDVENRGWAPTARQLPRRSLLVIHGAKRWDSAAGADSGFEDDECPTGYLGVVRYLGTCSDSAQGRDCRCSRWGQIKQHHWRLADPVRFPQAVPGPGRQGLWRPPDDVVLLARRCAALVVSTS